MAKRRKIFSSYLVTFPNYSLRTFQKKMPGQVRSGHQSGFVDLTSEKQSRQSQFFFHGAISSVQVFITVPVCVICTSQNLFICDMRSGQSRDLCIRGLRENNEMCPASSKRVKTTELFQDYDRLPDL